MDSKRWTLGVVLAAAVSLWGLVEADASPFSSYVLSDDLGNVVNGSAPEAGDGADEDWVVNNVKDGKDNNGHGNNEDGVDSSNQGDSKTGEDTVCEDGTVCDDEIKTNSGKEK
jgi:hypothetical protein